MEDIVPINMNRKITLFFVVILLIGLSINSNITAIFIKKPKVEIIPLQEKNHDPLKIENGIIIGRTIMTINYEPAGALQFANITI
jgi:hypothetical protein